MKAIKLPILLILAALLLVSACKTSQQQVAYNTLYTVEKATVAAYNGYVDAVIRGQARTNEVPDVSKKFDTFQLAFIVALDAVQFNTNALAPANLTVLSTDIINTITAIRGGVK